MAGNRFTRDERTTLLKGVGLFSNCTREELRRISSLTTPTTVDRGTVLMLQGQAGSEFFIVVSGMAIAARNDRELARYGPGSFFGELALLDGGSRTATVYAATDMELLVLSRSEFRSLQETAPSVAFKILNELGGRLRRADQIVDEYLESGSTITVPSHWTL